MRTSEAAACPRLGEERGVRAAASSERRPDRSNMTGGAACVAERRCSSRACAAQDPAAISLLRELRVSPHAAPAPRGTSATRRKRALRLQRTTRKILLRA